MTTVTTPSRFAWACACRMPATTGGLATPSARRSGRPRSRSCEATRVPTSDRDAVLVRGTAGVQDMPLQPRVPVVREVLVADVDQGAFGGLGEILEAAAHVPGHRVPVPARGRVDQQLVAVLRRPGVDVLLELLHVGVERQ